MMAWTSEQKRTRRRADAAARVITSGVCQFCGHAGRVQQARRWDERPVGEACQLCARAIYLMGCSCAWAERFDWAAVRARITSRPDGSATPPGGPGPRTGPRSNYPVGVMYGPGPTTPDSEADAARVRAILEPKP